jgi:hypothetical protein
MSNTIYIYVCVKIQIHYSINLRTDSLDTLTIHTVTHKYFAFTLTSQGG